MAAAAIIHRLNLLRLQQTMHSSGRDNPVLVLRNRLGRRRRVNVIIVVKRGIGRMNVENGSKRRKTRGMGTRLGTATGVRAGQRFTALLSLLSPIQPLRRSCWTQYWQTSGPKFGPTRYPA